MKTANTGHISTLDGLRGAAAFGVTIFHVLGPVHLTGPFDHGPLAVDFFFTLSGFVIAYAYEARLLGGMTFGAFFKARLVRLYPLIFAGIMLGALVSVAKMVMAGTSTGLEIALATAWGLLVLPFGQMPASPQAAFPLNFPVWSLFYELAVNFAFAAFARKLSTRVLFGLIALGFAGLLVYAVHANTLDAGASRDDYLVAITRVIFSFFLGIVLFRFRSAAPRATSGLGLLLVLMVILAIPHLRFDGLFDLVAVTIAFPSIVYLASHTQPGPRVSRFYLFIGAMSYPVYLLHYPIMRMFLAIQEKYALHGKLLWASAFVECLTIFVASYAALKLYDEPLRLLLKRRAATRALAVS